MVYDVRSVRLTFGGKFFVSETWSCGLRITGKRPDLDPIGGTVPTPVPPMSDLRTFCVGNLDDVVTKVKAYWAAMAAFTNAQASLDWVKFNPVDEHGKQDPEQDTIVSSFTPIAGGSGTPQFPQVALAISLTTGLQRGHAHTGRFYLPLGGSISVDANGHISTGAAQGAADPTAVFLTSLNDWSGIDPLWQPNVSIMSSLGAGTRRHVTGVRVGRTIDTQRRRRSSIPELYVTAATAVS